jgi:hypothetical protein
MANEEQLAILRHVHTCPGVQCRGTSPATRQIPHGGNLYPYKFVMSRILTHSCVTLNTAYK